MPLKEGKNPFETESLEEDENLNPQYSEGDGEQQSQDDEEDIKSWDKEKSVKAYRNLQRKITVSQGIINEATERAIRAEERARVLEEIATKGLQNNTQQNRQQEQTPVKPVKPAKPAGYSKADAIAYPDSESARYDLMLEKYYEDKEVYEDWKEAQYSNELRTVKESFEEQMNKQLQSDDFARRKAAGIARLASATKGDMQKASAVFDFVQRAMVKDDPNFYVALYDVVNNKQNKSNSEEDEGVVSKREDVRNRRNIPPLSMGSSNANEGDEMKSFMAGIKSQRKNTHNLFQTEKR